MENYFATQEAAAPTGRGSRIHVPTARRETFNAEQAKLAQSRERRQQRRTALASIGQVAPMIHPAGQAPPQNVHVAPAVSMPALGFAQPLQNFPSFNFGTTQNIDLPTSQRTTGMTNGDDFEHPNLVTTNVPVPANPTDDIAETEVSSDTLSSSPSTGEITSAPVPMATSARPQLQTPLVRRAVSTQPPLGSPFVPMPPLSHSPVEDTANLPAPVNGGHRLVRRSHMIPPADANNPNPQKTFTNQMVATLLGKRSDPPSLPSEDEEDDDNSPLCSLRLQDLNPARRRIATLAFVIFRLNLWGLDAFPSTDRVERWAVEAWYLAHHQLVTERNYVGLARPTDNEISLIKQRVNQLRGQVVTAARRSVPVFYNLGVTDLAMVRDRVGRLLQKDAFACKDWTAPAAPGGLYGSPLVSTLLNATAFGHGGRSEGLRGSMFENEVPLPTIAFILTAIQCAIEEYKGGQICPKPTFSKTVYEPVFRRHLNTLNKWAEFSAQTGRSGATKRLQKDLLLAARTHAGVENIPIASSEVGLTEADFLTNE